jgi:hypothetical protein
LVDSTNLAFRSIIQCVNPVLPNEFQEFWNTMTERITKIRKDGVHQVVFLSVSIKDNVLPTILMFGNGEPMRIR